ncbi:unnamed protein product [Spirodela intermedia]|uniref:Uncharacterized protein n=1 Tax=Spirodela intermedia TaxID=51605 RepID=A0A7I8JRZ1_SPIIN|nr:unnamed protein product [Spirodela intermedia]CAA6672894.1 unnamed protein product [Spirodela intermedia]
MAGYITRRPFSASPRLCRRIPQTENEIVKMFKLPSVSDGGGDRWGDPVRQDPWRPPRSRRATSARALDERFLRILKIFRWGPDAEKALEVMLLRVDHRLVLEILTADVEISTKLHFFRWAGKRKNFQHDASTYMALIRCLDEARLAGEMWNAIQDMVRSPCAIGPAELSEIVRILGGAKMVDKACTIFYQIKTRKCRATAMAYNAMIGVLMQEGHLEKVHEIYNEMCDEGGGCLPDTVTYESLIAAFCKLGRGDSAVRLFEEMKENHLQPTPKIYNTLMSMFFKSGQGYLLRSECLHLHRTNQGPGGAGRTDDAYKVFADMRRRGCNPDTVLINNLINIMSKAGRLEDALKLFDEMKALHCPPNVVTYNTIIKSLFDSKSDAAEASHWFEKMKENGILPSAFTYSILIDGLCKTNRVEYALRLLEEMDERGFPPCPAAYCTIRGGGELFHELRENCGLSSSRVYAVMIKHLGKCGRLDDALDLFSEMKKLGCTPDVFAYNALMAGMIMQEHGCAPDLNSHNIILNGLGKIGGPKPAMEMLSRMKTSEVKPDAVSYNTVLGSLSRAGMLEEAARLMKEMRLNGFDYDLINIRRSSRQWGKSTMNPSARSHNYTVCSL